MTREARDQRSVVYGVTIGKSAFGLLRGQLKWLQNHGWKASLATTPDDAALRTAAREEVALHGIPMARKVSPVTDVRALAKWVGLLHRLRPAAVNVSTPKAGLLGGVAAWMTRVPKRIYVVRGLRLEGTRGFLSKILWVMEWITMKAATDVVFVSPSLARACAERGLLDKSKSWQIGSGSSNGVDSEAVYRRATTADVNALRESLDLNEDDFVVGFVGRITRDKGVHTLVRAFNNPKLYANARLVAIGPMADGDLGESLKQLEGRVRWVPPTDDVWAYLSIIDVLCLPTIREGFPNVVLEAASAEVPTITTTATGAIDSVVDGVTGLLIEPGDTEALVNAVNEMASDQELVSRMGRAARQRAVSEFKPERIWRGILAVLSGDTHGSEATKIGTDGMESAGEA